MPTRRFCVPGLRIDPDVSVPIEQARHNRYRIIVAVFSFAEMKMFYIEVRHHCYAGHPVIAFEKLRVQIHRKLAQLFARKERFLDLLLGRLLCVDQPFRRIVSLARLQLIMPPRFSKSHLQRVEASVQAQILW